MMSTSTRTPMTQLSVNVNKIAVLRNSRGGQLPDPVAFARLCLHHGAQGITVHPRPDARHIRADDVYRLAQLCALFGAEFNIEGNPFAPPRPGYPGLLALCAQTRPAQVTFVPDSEGQITSDHGFDFAADESMLRDVIPAFKELGCRISCFADASADTRLEIAKAVGADRIEIYTGPYAQAFDAMMAAPEGEHMPFVLEMDRIVGANANLAHRAGELGLGVNAGHDLTQFNLGLYLQHVPDVAEVSIGHALISDCLIDGVEQTIANYLQAAHEPLAA